MEHLKQKAVAFLRKTESYTKTDMVYLAKGGSFLGLGQVVSSGVAFLLSIAFANLFPPEAYGIYKYILSVVGVVAAFSLTGMDAAVSQAVARGFDGTLRASFWIMFRWTLLTSSILTIVAVYYFFHNNATLAWGLIIAAIAIPVLKSSALYNGFLIGKKDFSKKVRYGMVYDALPAACIGISLFFTNNPLIVVGSYFVSYTLVSLIFYKKTTSTYPTDAPADPKATSYSFHLSAMNILGAVSFQIDKVLTFHYLGAIQLASYSFAIALPQQLKQLQKILGTLVFPRFSNRTIDSIRENIWGKAGRLFLLMILIVFCYILLAPYIFKLFFPQYLGSVFYSQLYSLTLLVSPVVFFKQALTAHRQTRALYISQIFPPILKIVLLVIATPLFGIVGIIGALLVTDVVGFITTALAFSFAQKEDSILPTEDSL